MTRGKVWHGSQPWWFRRSGPQQHCCPSVMSGHCINSQLPTSVPCHLPKQRLSPQLNAWKRHFKWTSEGLQDDHCLGAARTENRHGKSFLPFFFLLRLANAVQCLSVAFIFSMLFFSPQQLNIKPNPSTLSSWLYRPKCFSVGSGGRRRGENLAVRSLVRTQMRLAYKWCSEMKRQHVPRDEAATLDANCSPSSRFH